MLWRDAAAVLFGQQAAFGDAEQGVVRLEHRGGGEEAVVGGDQRQAQRVGQGDHAGFDGLLVRQVVAVQLHHRAVGKGFGGLAQPALGFGLLAVGQEAGERPGGAAGQQDQAGGVLGDAIERELRLQAGIGVEEAARGQALQVGEAGCVLRQQDDLLGRQARVVGASEGELAADDRLDALGGAGLAELQGAEQVAGVGDGDGGHLGVARQGGEFLRFDGALAERIGGMGAEVDEISVGHGGTVGRAGDSRPDRVGRWSDVPRVEASSAGQASSAGMGPYSAGPGRSTSCACQRASRSAFKIRNGGEYPLADAAKAHADKESRKDHRQAVARR